MGWEQQLLPGCPSPPHKPHQFPLNIAVDAQGNPMDEGEPAAIIDVPNPKIVATWLLKVYSDGDIEELVRLLKGA